MRRRQGERDDWREGESNEIKLFGNEISNEIKLFGTGVLAEVFRNTPSGEHLAFWRAGS